MDDLDRVVAMFRDVELAFFGEAEDARMWVDEVWRCDWVDLPTRSLLVFAPDGSLAASGGLEAIDPSVAVEAFIRVHPAHVGRGLGSGLIGWTEGASARLIVDGSTVVWNTTSAADQPAVRLLASAGYLHVRTFWHMRMDLPDRFEPGAVPAGITIRRSVTGQDDVGIYEVIQEAFRSHFGYQVIGLDQWWDNMRRTSAFDPAMTFVAVEGDRIVGTSIQFAEGEIGWVGDLGVRPASQGRGIGHALLRHALADLARRGFRIAQLNVDRRTRPAPPACTGRSG